MRSEDTFIHNRLRWHISITLVLSVSKKVVSRTKRIGQGVSSAYKKSSPFLFFNILFLFLFAKTKTNTLKKDALIRRWMRSWIDVLFLQEKRKWTINLTFCLWSENHSHSLWESPASEINLTLGSNFTRLELGFKNYMEFSLIIFLLHFSSSNIEAGTLSCSFGLKIPMEVNAIVSIDVQYLYIQIYLNMKIFLELILIISIDMR